MEDLYCDSGERKGGKQQQGRNKMWPWLECRVGKCWVTIFLRFMTLGKLFNCPFFQFPFRWNMVDNSASLIGLATWYFKFECVSHNKYCQLLQATKKQEIECDWAALIRVIISQYLVFWHLLGDVYPTSIPWFCFRDSE